MSAGLLVPFTTMAVQMIIDGHLVREYEKNLSPHAAMEGLFSSIMDFETYSSCCIYDKVRLHPQYETFANFPLYFVFPPTLDFCCCC